MSSPPDTPGPSGGFNLLAGVAAAVFPGAGHWVLGERKRAGLVATGVLGLFFGGILIGGIDVIDSREDRVWFFGQALVGPIAFGVDRVHQGMFKGVPGSQVFEGSPAGPWRTTEQGLEMGRALTRSAHPNEIREVVPVTVETRTGSTRVVEVPVLRARKAEAAGGPPSIKSLSKVNELGTLFATIAGMLNVIVIVDAALPGRRKG